MEGERIEATGTLSHAAGGFVLRSDAGVTYALRLPRTPVDHVEKRVAVAGRLTADNVLEVHRIAAG